MRARSHALALVLLFAGATGPATIATTPESQWSRAYGEVFDAWLEK
jgi:hypothetical protein